MDLLGRKAKKMKARIEAVESNIVQSFTKARSDTTSIVGWLNYYYRRSQFYEEQFENLTVAINKLNTFQTESTDSIERHSDLLTELTNKLEELMRELQNLRSRVSQVPPHGGSISPD